MKMFNTFISLMVLGFFVGCTSKDSYQSYKTLKNFHIKSPESEVVELRHEKSGAKVVLIKNGDPARTFMVTFKTPPYDDTGLFHIFEHSVLAGSRFYPSKSNFFNVLRSSVAAFINAMTGSVSTYYPFVTRDPGDFDNLLPVYMDAVFFPKTVEDPRIVKREGWRYEVDPKTKKMSVNGIVLSEMKGAFSSPYRTLFFHLSRSLLPQTPYSYSSGGLPEKIATLHFNQIVEAHKKYYHPQNSVIYLYGDIDYKKTLGTIDEKFLNHFEKTPGFVSPEITFQTDFNYPDGVVQTTYQGQEAPNKDFVVKSYVLGPLTSVQRDIAYIIATAFASETASPLRLRILKEGLAKSAFSMGLESRDNAFGFVFEGTESAQKEKFGKILKEEIEKVVEKGLDQELLTSILNKYEFSYKEKYSNGSFRGYRLGMIVSENWLYPDLSLEEDLDYMGRFRELRKWLGDGEFVKSFFKKHFLENSRSRWLVMKPDPLFSEKFNKGLEKKVEEALREKPLAEYQKEDEVYRQWVKAEEPPEVKGKTPLLKLSDITVREKPIDFNKIKMGSTEVIEYPQETSGISYIKLFFDLRGVKKGELRNLEFFTSFLKKTDTANYSFQDLSKQIDLHTGGIGFGVSTYQSFKNPEKFKPLLSVTLSFLNENLEKSFSLLKELLMESQFTPLDRLDSLVKEMKIRMVNTVSYRGPSLSRMAASKDFFPALGSFEDEVEGGTFEEYVLKSKFDPKPLSSNLKGILKSVFNQNRLHLVTITANKKDLKKLGSKVGELKSLLPSGDSGDQVWSFSDQKNYKGYAIPGEVQYLAEVASFRDQGLEYTGAMRVYTNYLDAQFMTPRLREQAGSYGAGSSLGWDGLFTLSTYRDPHLKQSFETFSQAVEFMKNEKLNNEKLKPAILGSLKSYYDDKSISAKTSFMTNLYLVDRSWDDYMKVKKEILSTTSKDFQKISEALSQALKKSKKAVTGNSVKLKKEAPFLKRILSFQ